MKPRRNRLTPGTPVHHAKHGDGRVLGEWGPLEVWQDTTSSFSSGFDVYDVMFGVGDGRHLHCCRIEYLERI